jgi:hypothetical protein
MLKAEQKKRILISQLNSRIIKNKQEKHMQKVQVRVQTNNYDSIRINHEYNSLFHNGNPPLLNPPTIKTSPSGSTVVVW